MKTERIVERTRERLICNSSVTTDSFNEEQPWKSLLCALIAVSMLSEGTIT